MPIIVGIDSSNEYYRGGIVVLDLIQISKILDMLV